MKFFTIFALFSLSLYGQSLSLTGPATVKQGKTFTINVNLTGSTATAPAAAQWTLNVGGGLSTTGTSTSVPNKNVQCSTAANPLCIIYGINQNVIPNGVIAAHTISVPANTPTGSKNFSLVSPIAVTTTGASWPITSGTPIATPYTIIVTSIADINNDGVINSADVGLMADQVTGGTCSDDQNGDSACNIIDVYLVVLRALGV